MHCRKTTTGDTDGEVCRRTAILVVRKTSRPINTVNLIMISLVLLTEFRNRDCDERNFTVSNLLEICEFYEQVRRFSKWTNKDEILTKPY